MAQQLIFTSAVAGLNPGSSGYCTVARSEALREAVAMRLEQWSVYTHAASGLRPVICAHRILNLRGSIFHVLTRIVDSGLDYTGRTNFLAHHLVLQPHEIHGACSPAEVFRNWKGWLAKWQGVPPNLEDSSLSIHALPRTTQMPARAWAEAAGDAGAATLLLKEGAENTSAKSVDLIVPVGHEKGLLKLFAESLHLTDPNGENAPAAWAVTFTTFLQTENDPSDFRWRGLWPEDRRRVTSEVLCDFVNGILPTVSSGLLADYARTGYAKTRAGLAPSVSEYAATATQSSSQQLTTAQVPGSRSPRQSLHPRIESAKGKVPSWIWLALLIGVPAGVGGGMLIGKWTESRSLVTMQPSQQEPEQTLKEPTIQTPSPPPSDPSPAPAASQSPPDQITQQERDQIDGIIAQLKKRQVQDPHSNLNSVRADELVKLNKLLEPHGAPDLQLEPYAKEVAEIDKNIDTSNNSYADLEALAKIPDGIVYVVNSTDRKLEISDPGTKEQPNPLRSWVEGIISDPSSEAAYTVSVQSASVTDSKKLHLESDESGSGHLVSESSEYTFAPGFVELGEGLNPSETALISFIPNKNISSPPFRILVSGLKPMFSISRSAAMEQQPEPPTVQCKSILKGRFSQWKDSDGKLLKLCLQVQMAGSAAPLRAQEGLAFTLPNKSNLERQQDLDKAKGDVQKAEQEVSACKGLQKSQDYFANLQLSKGTLSALNGPTGLGPHMTGELIYTRVSGWVGRICEDDAAANSVLPPTNDPSTRIANIVAAIDKLNALAAEKETRASESQGLKALANDLSSIPWQEHVALLSNANSEPTMEKANADLTSAKESERRAQDELDHSPKLADIDKIWICGKTNSGNNFRIVEVLNEPTAHMEVGSSHDKLKNP